MMKDRIAQAAACEASNIGESISDDPERALVAIDELAAYGELIRWDQASKLSPAAMIALEGIRERDREWLAYTSHQEDVEDAARTLARTEGMLVVAKAGR